METPFRFAATYRPRHDLKALRDQFSAGEPLVYVGDATSIYDSMRGFFFRSPGADRIRSWDVPLGEAIEGTGPFEQVAPAPALIVAAEAGALATVRAELAAMTDPAAPMFVELAAERAALRGHADILEALLVALPEDRRERLLHHAARHRSARCVAVLLDAGAPVDARDRAGQTPLRHAAAAGALETVALLLARGADPAAETGAGVSPLRLAKAHRHDAIVALISAALARA
ncbi:MAG: ankyrin repeat domain-containing protein [Nannocystaceae bacterium]